MGVILSGIFPDLALAWVPLSYVLLFLLMFLAAATVELPRVSIYKSIKPVFLFILFGFVLFPAIQWLLTESLLGNQQIAFGLMFSAFCPVALVAPYFAKERGGDVELSFLLMLTSLFLTPIVVPLALPFVFPSYGEIQIQPLIKFFLVLVTLPTGMGFLFSHFFSNKKNGLLRWLPLLNSALLGALVFILVGSNWQGGWSSAFSISEIVKVLTVFIFQDFIVFYLANGALKLFVSDQKRVSLVLALSLKNIAVAAGFLLNYDMVSATAVSWGFVVHTVFFFFLSNVKKENR